MVTPTLRALAEEGNVVCTQVGVAGLVSYSHLSRSKSSTRLEEGFHNSIVVTISLATHRHLEVMLAQDILVIMTAILAAPVGMMKAAFGRRPQCDCHFQCSDCKVTFHTIAYRPADHPPGM